MLLWTLGCMLSFQSSVLGFCPDIHPGVEFLGHMVVLFFPFVGTWVDLEGTMLKEISQTEKDKYYMISLICGI